MYSIIASDSEVRSFSPSVQAVVPLTLFAPVAAVLLQGAGLCVYRFTIDTDTGIGGTIKGVGVMGSRGYLEVFASM